MIHIVCFNLLKGVGWSISKKLETLGATDCGQLYKINLGTLQKEFGPKTGQSLYNYARGIDSREIKVEKERKSVSAEINYGIRFTTVGSEHHILKLQIYIESMQFY